MKYRKKAAVDAYQMTPEVLEDLEAWPVWLQTAYDKPIGTVGAVWNIGRSPRLYLGTLSGPVPVTTNGWVIRGDKRQLSAMTAETFAETYVAVEE